MSVNTRRFSRTSDWRSALVWTNTALRTFSRHLVAVHRLAEALIPTAALTVLVLFSGM